MSDKRKYPRVEAFLDARWQGTMANCNVRIADLSEGGCYIDTIGEVIVGEPLLLKILMPNGQTLDLEGIVVHHSPRLGFGVRFVNLSEKQRSQVRSLIESKNE